MTHARARSLSSLLLLCLCAPGYAQFGSAIVIDDQLNGATTTDTADLDGDGDADVVAGGSNATAIGWYENLGGGAFGARQALASQPDRALAVFATDLDGDGDADILAGVDYWTPELGHDFQLVRYINQGGGTFGTPLSLDYSDDSHDSLRVTDMDGDGDVDVLYASWSDSVFWIEGLGGGQFAQRQEITSSLVGATDAHPADLDGDGDADVLTASRGNDEIAWFENTGGAWTKTVLNAQADGAWSVYSADLDGDGDVDVLSSSVFDDTVAWYENQGAGVFGQAQTITTSDNAGRAVRAADLDGDCDPDVLVSEVFGAAWYENLGGGTFGARAEIGSSALGARAVHAADFDEDGVLDVLVTSFNDTTIAWHASSVPALGTRYCGPAVPNTSGGAARMGATGSAVVADDDLTICASELPLHQFGYFLASQTQDFVAGPGGSAGNLCVGGAIGRFNQQIVSSGASGTISIEVDLAAIPVSPPRAVLPGETWNFQGWFRDAGATSNFTDGLSITFL
ncbi:MAG: VCBS repeat-containing protein [bacterium]|nr:VCBS repeat-containing protein [bacterium]